MMTLYVSPYRRLANLRETMDRLFDESIPEFQSAERERLLAVNVVAEDDAFIIRAFVPGLEAEDLSIETLNNTVAIRGEFKSDDVEDTRYLFRELPEGKFVRVITLPVDVDSAEAEATIKNGSLTLRVPKAESQRPKTIKVSVN